MTIKRVLVPFPAAQPIGTAFEIAALVAERFAAQLAAVCIQPDLAEQLSRVVHAESVRLSEHGIHDVIGQAERAVQEARTRFETVARGRNMRLDGGADAGPSARWSVLPHLGGQALLRQSMLADLVVLGRPRQGEPPPSDILDVALFSLGTPVLVAPAVAAADIGGRILLGWTPTVQAARAVMRSVPFLAKAREVRIVSVGTGAKEGLGAADAADYLALHGIRAAVSEVPPEGRGVPEILLREARTFGADLLVMGAYSHSRVREMILGGVTRAMLTSADLPVLMVH